MVTASGISLFFWQWCFAFPQRRSYPQSCPCFRGGLESLISSMHGQVTWVYTITSVHYTSQRTDSCLGTRPHQNRFKVVGLSLRWWHKRQFSFRLGTLAIGVLWAGLLGGIEWDPRMKIALKKSEQRQGQKMSPDRCLCCWHSCAWS